MVDKKRPEAAPAPANEKVDTEAPPAPASLDHPIARAFVHLVAARSELVRARANRGVGVEVIGDAAVLARALLLIGGALPDDAAPWALAHALADMPGMADEDGTDLLGRFVDFVKSALYATRRRKALDLPARGLERFADLAARHPSRPRLVEALEAQKAEENRERERGHAEEAERQRAVNALRPTVAATQGPPIPELPNEDDGLRV